MKVNQTFIPYNRANEIRIKLLLFIDKEVQDKKKEHKITKSNITNENEFLIKFEETYQSSDYFVYPIKVSFHNEKDNKLKKTLKNSAFSISTCDASPYTINREQKQEQKIIRKSIHHKTVPENIKNINQFSNFRNSKKNKTITKNNDILNTIISFDEKQYSFNMLSRPSSTVNIFLKPKTNKQYLKDLCHKLKISKPQKRKLNSCKINEYSESNSIKVIPEYRKIQLNCPKMNKNRNSISPLKPRKTKCKLQFQKLKLKKYRDSYTNIELLYNSYSISNSNENSYRNKTGLYKKIKSFK